MTKTEVKEKNKVGEMTLFNLKTKLSNYHVTETTSLVVTKEYHYTTNRWLE